MPAWFDSHSACYEQLCLVAVIIVGTMVLRAWREFSSTSERPTADWAWWLAIFVLLAVGRWPGFFITRELNPDESQLLAGAITLHHDPVFWRSVDGGTAGPLDFFALFPAGWITGIDNYFSARLTALLLIGAALLFAHLSLARMYGRGVARSATFSAVCFEAFTLHPDFLHYSTEIVPLTLLSGAFYLATRLVLSGLDKSSWLWSLGLGVVLGAVPFAKLQAAPMAVASGLIMSAIEFGQLRRNVPRARSHLTGLIVGALGPAGLLSLQLTFTHQWENAVIPYILANLSYLDAGLHSIRTTSEELAANLARPAELYTSWLGTELLLVLILLIGIAVWKKPLPARKNFLAAAVAFLVVSFFCVFAPRRPFPHYLQFTVIPLTLVFGSALGELAKTYTFSSSRRQRALLVTALFVSIADPLWVRAQVTHPDVGRLRAYQASPREMVAAAIRLYGNAGEALGFWGWHSRYYVETGMWHATRDAWATAEIFKNQYADYYHRRYLADMMLHKPPVFVDASDTLDNPFTADQIAHEKFFPALGRFIQAHYTLVETIDHIRIYARNDRAGRGGLIKSTAVPPPKS